MPYTLIRAIALYVTIHTIVYLLYRFKKSKTEKDSWVGLIMGFFLFFDCAVVICFVIYLITSFIVWDFTWICSLT